MIVTLLLEIMTTPKNIYGAYYFCRDQSFVLGTALIALMYVNSGCAKFIDSCAPDGLRADATSDLRHA